MEIRIELDNEKVENNALILSDKGFDSAVNWVSVKLFDGVNTVWLGDAQVNELFSMLVAFDAKFNKDKVED